MLKNILVFIFIILFAIQAQATTRKVLFLGNSYIYTNNLPLVVQQIATSMGDTLIYEENNIGGYTMQAHSIDAVSINKIYAQPWDIVVLQEQSQRPAFSPGQVATDTYPFARKLDSLIRDHRSCTETMFFMTWGYKNGDASNCAFYPPICTYAGMQQRLRESYLQMAQDNNAIVSPVGAVWKQVRDSFPAINLYSPDESHPSMEGTYLAACVFYTSIFHKNPATTTVTSGIAAVDAAKLSRMAGKMVLDSFSKWNQYGNYTYANFTKSVSGKVANFTNTSVSATTYNWAFGNGNTSIATSPSQTYATNGLYIVTLNASNTCFSETKKDSVVIGPTGIYSIRKGDDNLKAFATGDGGLCMSNTADVGSITVTVMDMNGRILENLTVSAGATVQRQLIPGLYVCRIVTEDLGIVSKKVLVY